MPTIETAAVAACAFAALFAGHHLGDHPIQPDAAAQHKGHPTDDQLAAGVHPWTGWLACARHVATYTLTQALALALISLVAPLTLAGAAAALAASASTHAVIDRRWIVRLLIQAKGCQDWREAPYLLDQSLHIGVLLVAAVLAGAVTTASGAMVVTTAGLALVCAGLATEQLRARRAAGRAGDPSRL